MACVAFVGGFVEESGQEAFDTLVSIPEGFLVGASTYFFLEIYDSSSIAIVALSARNIENSADWAFCTCLVLHQEWFLVRAKATFLFFNIVDHVFRT